MSACQKKSVSCFACCGLANLNLTSEEKDGILVRRTEQFEGLNMDFSLFPDFRRSREEQEASIPRHNLETYVCPFLGYIEPHRPGCLIHPARTGDSKSQNYSFYGASICLGYDCPAKEREEETESSLYSDFLEANLKSEYHRLVCDSELYSLLETITDFPDSVCRTAEASDLLVRLLKLRLNHPQSQRITSFERLMVRSRASEAVMALFRQQDWQEARETLLELEQIATVASAENKNLQ